MGSFSPLGVGRAAHGDVAVRPAGAGGRPRRLFLELAQMALKLPVEPLDLAVRLLVRDPGQDVPCALAPGERLELALPAPAPPGLVRKELRAVVGHDRGGRPCRAMAATRTASALADVASSRTPQPTSRREASSSYPMNHRPSASCLKSVRRIIFEWLHSRLIRPFRLNGFLASPRQDLVHGPVCDVQPGRRRPARKSCRRTSCMALCVMCSPVQRSMYLRWRRRAGAAQEGRIRPHIGAVKASRPAFFIGGACRPTSGSALEQSRGGGAREFAEPSPRSVQAASEPPCCALAACTTTRLPPTSSMSLSATGRRADARTGSIRGTAPGNIALL